MAYFSIIVPVYNVEAYLSQCVNNILCQTFQNFELLLIDDGSPDDSGALCDKYAEKDNRVRVIHKQNGGLSSARNCGLRNASGEYIIFLDSDDYWDKPNALETIYQEISATDCDVVLLKHRKFNMENSTFENCFDSSSTNDINGLSYADQLRFCVSKQLFDTCAWNKVFRHDLMLKQDLYFTEGIISEDLDWAARLSLVATRLAIVKDPIHVYRKGRPGAITTSLKLKNLVDTKGSIERCLDYVSYGEYDVAFLTAYYGYVAYRYVIWMAEGAVVKNSGKKALISAMKQYKWLLKYDLNRKVQHARRLTGIAGFTLASKLLGLYLAFKR